MKAVLFATLALASSLTFAQQSAAPVQAKPAQSAANLAEFDKQMTQVQDNMKKMQEQMTKLQQTQDPQERQRLLEEHWTNMQGGMTMMHGMWGPTMMGCCGRGGHMMGGGMMGGMMMGGPMGWQDYYSKLTPEQVKQRQYMADQYLATQQQMMSHMMWHQHWMSQRLSPQK